MRIWVTRTQPGADATAAKLDRMGHQPVVQPVLAFEAIPDAALDLSRATALAFTSAHGVAAYSALTPRRDLPVYVTGEATAVRARLAGFTRVHPAGGDVDQLADLIITDKTGIGGEVVWPCALEPAGDLAGRLEQAGIPCTPQLVYRTVEAAGLAPEGIDALLIHSPRGASAVATHLEPAAAAKLSLFAISAKAAEPLAHLPFARVAIAPRPNETALLDLIAG